MYIDNFYDNESYYSDSFYDSEYYDDNDINFKINDDVEFTLSTSDNYEGRDIDVGVDIDVAACQNPCQQSVW